MAERSQSVIDRVARALRDTPGSRSRDLYDLAKQVDPAVGDLSVRQFHASYVLPARRAGSKGAAQKVTRAKGGRKSGPTREKREASPREPRPVAAPAASGEREVVRRVLLRFASDISGAETRSEIVGVLAGLDGYVEQILRARR